MDIEAYLASWQGEAPVLLGSAAVVAFMVGMAALLGFRQRAKLDEANVAGFAAAEGGEVAEAAISDDGAAALARLKDGRLLGLRVMGADVSVRAFQPGQAHYRRAGGRFSVTFADLGYPALHMRLKESPAWLAALAGAGNA